MGRKRVSAEHRRARINTWTQNYRKRSDVKATLRANMLRVQYGLTPESFGAMLIGQGSVCAICGLADWGGRHGVPIVDHCHATGTIRGILCHDCNAAIGFLKDDPRIAQKIAVYLGANS